MRRYASLSVIVLLMAAVASPVNAGYLIIRVILDGSSSPGDAGIPGGNLMGSGGGGRAPGGAGIGGTGGDPGDSIGGGTPRPGSGGGMVTPTTPGTTIAVDPTRSIVVVIPIEEDLQYPTP